MKRRMRELLAVLIVLALFLAPLGSMGKALAVTEPNKVPADAVAWDGSIATEFAGGTGAADAPYQIENGAQLAFLAQQVNSGVAYAGAFFVLTADILLNDTADWTAWGTTEAETSTIIAPANVWTSIGTQNETSELPFSGSFDGAGHTILGLFLSNEQSAQGLFGYCYADEEYAAIENLTIASSYVRGGANVGAIVGMLGGSHTVQNCHNDGTVFGTIGDVGGIVGNAFGVLQGCTNSGAIFAEGDNAGGIAGENAATISNCKNLGALVSTSDNAGGVTGYAWDVLFDCTNSGAVQGNASVGGVAGSMQDSIMLNCQNSGAISGVNDVGGLAGSVFAEGMAAVQNSANSGAISGSGTNIGGIVGRLDTFLSTVAATNCYNSGTVSGGFATGGLIGRCDADNQSNAALCNSYNVGTVSGAGNSCGGLMGAYENVLSAHCFYLASCIDGGTVFGTSLSEAELKQAPSYIDWDFRDVWAIEATDAYPYPQFARTLSAYAEEASVWDGSVAAAFAQGDGSEGAPYVITTAAALALLASDVHAGTTYEGTFFRLDADVVLNDCTAKYWVSTATPWTPIGASTQSGFQGVFDGNGHTVFGVVAEGARNVGVFGWVQGGTIQNLTVADSYICAAHAAGGIAGLLEQGTITGCQNLASVNGGDGIGGVVGECTDSDVTRCSNAGTVYGCENVGGVVGNYAANVCTKSIETCYNLGAVGGVSTVGGIAGTFGTALGTATLKASFNKASVTAVASCVGGIVGVNRSYRGVSTIQNCYNVGAVSGYDQVGGVAGCNESTATDDASEQAHAHVRTCYNVGTLTATGALLGGVVGSNRSNAYGEGVAQSLIEDSCYLDSCGASVGTTNAEGTGMAQFQDMVMRTDAQLRVQAQYGDAFDFDTTWTMEGDPTYPYAELKENLLLPTFSVTYVANGNTVETFSVTCYETLSDIPSVPYRYGYSGAWDVDLTGVAITQSYTVTAVYTYTGVYGDVNMDGTVTSADASALMRYIVGLETLSEHVRILANVNGDTVITSSDATDILRYVVGLLDHFAVVK